MPETFPSVNIENGCGRGAEWFWAINTKVAGSIPIKGDPGTEVFMRSQFRSIIIVPEDKH